MNQLRPIRGFVFWVAIVSLLVGGAPSLAQGGLGTLVHPRQGESITWSADSRLLVFYDVPDAAAYELPGVEASGSYWYQYDLDTGELTTSAIWPLQPDLTTPELALLDPVTNPQGQPSYIFSSPDERFLVYAQETSEVVPPVYVSNREQVVAAGFSATGFFAGPQKFRLFWSGNGDAFAAVHYGYLNPVPQFVYVTGYDGGAELLPPTVIESYFEIAGRIFLPVEWEETIYDLSADGTQVLLTVQEFDPQPYKYPTRLLIWEPLNPDNSLIIEDFDGYTIQAASFSPQGETALLLVNETGLVHYDTLTQTSTVLRDDITARTVSDASFSPDGRWLMVRNTDGIHLISMVDEEGQ